MFVNVLFFASYRDLTGTRQVKVELDENVRVLDLKSELVIQFPELQDSINSALISIDKEFAFDEDIITETTEVAVFPPVSGGHADEMKIFLAIDEDRIDLNHCLEMITTEETGAACIFTGIVRANTTRGEPHQTEYLEYEAYKQMAEIKLKQVADELKNNWPMVERIVIVQRIGHLKPGEPTVVVACSAAHRDTGVFQAAKFGIDRLKEIVPVWKKEVGPHGERWIEGEYRPNINDKS